MAVPPTSPAGDRRKVEGGGSKESSPSQAKRRSKNPGVRVQRGRIYDSENGSTCHQCRQKTLDFAASCKAMIGQKPCVVKFCHKCLLNRYGEKAEEVSALDEWSCPKCRGLCNCSFCRKKKGQQPTGILVHKAKLTGFASVHEMLSNGGKNVDNEMRDVAPSPKKSPPPKNGIGQPKRCRGKENCNFENSGIVKSSKNLKNDDKPSKRLKHTSPVIECEMSDAGKIKKKLHIKNPKDDLPAQADNIKEILAVNSSKNLKDCKPSKRLKTKNLEDDLPTQADNTLTVKSSKSLKKDDEPSKRLKHDGPECGMSDASQIKKNLQINNQENGLPAQENKVKKNLKGITKDKTVEKPPKPKGRPPNILTKLVKEHVLPQGKPLTMVAGIALPVEDVGPALQFLEFCNVFSKILDIKKGEPEAIIRELVRGFSSRRSCRATSAIIQFQIRLLSFIKEDMGEKPSLESKGENSWLKALGKCLEEYKHLSMEFPLNFVYDYAGYNNLNSSIKLRILLFLCDEVLSTEALRNYLDEENTKFAEEEKDRRDHIIAAKRKERHIRQTLKDDLAKAMISTEGVVSLSISEHEKLISKIRCEAEKAHQEMLESTNLLPEKRQAPDAIRTIPLYLEKDGIVFWRLKSYDRSSSIIFQDIEKWSVIKPQDKWFIFDDEEREKVEKYISSLRFQKVREEKEHQKNARPAVRMKDNSLGNSESQNCLVEVN